jgi:hypothetical protein
VVVDRWLWQINEPRDVSEPCVNRLRSLNEPGMVDEPWAIK